MGKYSIEIENFSKSFGNLLAVDNLSFKVNDGEVFAFLGAFNSLFKHSDKANKTEEIKDVK